MRNRPDRTSKYRADSLSLIGAVALGAGVMIGAGIFALTDQMAEVTGNLFPLAFLSAALVVSFSAYSYVKLSNAYPSGGGSAHTSVIIGVSAKYDGYYRKYYLHFAHLFFGVSPIKSVFCTLKTGS